MSPCTPGWLAVTNLCVGNMLDHSSSLGVTFSSGDAGLMIMSD
jgi:hypothetical protein